MLDTDGYEVPKDVAAIAEKYGLKIKEYTLYEDDEGRYDYQMYGWAYPDGDGYSHKDVDIGELHYTNDDLYDWLRENANNIPTREEAAE